MISVKKHTQFSFAKIFKGIYKKIYLTTFAFSALALCFFIIYFKVSGLEDPSAIYVFVILLAGIFAVSAFTPFDSLFIQSGFPGLQSILAAAVILTNVMLNFLLIPKYGVVGAAYATSISYLLGGVYLVVLAKKYLNVSFLRGN